MRSLVCSVMLQVTCTSRTNEIRFVAVNNIAVILIYCDNYSRTCYSVHAVAIHLDTPPPLTTLEAFYLGRAFTIVLGASLAHELSRFLLQHFSTV